MSPPPGPGGAPEAGSPGAAPARPTGTTLAGDPLGRPAWANVAGFVGEDDESGTVAGVGAAAFGPTYGVSGQHALPFIAAAGLIAAMATMLALIAARTTVRHDIT